MQMSSASKVFPRLFEHQELDSTNLELQRQNLQELEEFSAVMALSQTSGKGRLGRNWQSPRGCSLSLSVLIKPRDEAEFNWVTLTAALAVKQAVDQLGIQARVKWPNDLLVDGKKLCGILATLEDKCVILGIGVNLKPWDGQLDTATSLQELGAEVSADQLAGLIGQRLKELVRSFRLDAHGVQSEFRAVCQTIGEQVRAELPNGKELYGVAQTVNDLGQLVILSPEPIALSAADVWHLRN